MKVVKNFNLNLLVLLSLIGGCKSEVKKELDIAKGKQIIASITKQLSPASPIKETTLMIADMLYLKGLNEDREGEITTLLNEFDTDKHINLLIDGLNLKGDSASILQDLFYRWDRDQLLSVGWVDRKDENIFYLSEPFKRLITSTNLNEKSASIILRVLNDRYPNNGSYHIYTQNMLADALLSENLDSIDSDVKTQFIEVLSPLNGKVSSNGRINIMRKKLGLREYR
ncbi:MAG: hypothetical protein RIF33_02140 [Cyclobacteriaceae bacterium]